MSETGAATRAVAEPVETTEDEPCVAEDARAIAAARDPWAYWVAVAVFVVGLMVTGILVCISASTY